MKKNDYNYLVMSDLDFPCDKVLGVLRKRQSENSCLDYKRIPYLKEEGHEFIRDVIAMLNSIDGIDKDKYIIFGVDDNKGIVGVPDNRMQNDNEWQNLVDKITPRPQIETGTVTFEDKEIAYIFISKNNKDYIYEVKDTVISDSNKPLREKNGAFAGQAFMRNGSKKVVMTEKDRALLRKTISQNSIINSSGIFPIKTRPLLCQVLLGSWNEKIIKDRHVISELHGDNYSDLIQELKNELENNSGSITFSNGIWSCGNHKEQILENAYRIYDNEVDSFFNIAKRVFSEYNPKYLLDQELRLITVSSDIDSYYSRELLDGIAETIAILGNNADSFVNCTHNHIRNKIYEFEKAVLYADDWKVYASIAEDFKYFGEACPRVFIECIHDLLVSENQHFIQYLNEKEEFVTITQYGYQLKWIFSELAILENCFSQAIEVLFLLSEYREDFIDSIVEIILPWYPKTLAGKEARLGIFKSFRRRNSDLAWKILMKLMPNATTTSIQIQEPKFLVIDHYPEKVTADDYYDMSIEYIDFACESIDGKIDRACNLIEIIEDVSYEIQCKIIYSVMEESNAFSHEEKEVLWNKIEEYINDNVYYSGVRGLKKETIQLLEEFKSYLFFDDTLIMEKRMFINNQYRLLKIDSDDKDEECLHKTQKQIVFQYYNSDGVDAVKKFSDGVENKRLVGLILSDFIKEKDLRQIIMNDNDLYNNDLIAGLVYKANLNTVKKVIIDLPEKDKSAILSYCQLSDDLINLISNMDSDSQTVFWSKVDVFKGRQIKNEKMFDYLIRSLVKNGRYGAAIELLFTKLCVDKEMVQAELVFDTMTSYAKEYKESYVDTYQIQELILWYQNHCKETEKIRIIEWQYMALLNSKENKPIYLWDMLSTDPDICVKIINVVFNDAEHIVDETIKKQCHRLLLGWKQIPGKTHNNSFDYDVFLKWTQRVEQEDSKTLNYVKTFLGHTIFYAPADITFFIDRRIAEYIDKDSNENVRDGYHTESINSRGIFNVDPTGKQEFEIEDYYKSLAQEAENNGYLNFAVTLRKIAEFYHREGIEAQNR